MSPTRLFRTVHVGGREQEISVEIPEKVSGWQELHHPDPSVRDQCFVYAKAHSSKQGHRVYNPLRYRYSETDLGGSPKHIGDFQTEPVTIYSRRNDGLSIKAQWIPPQPGSISPAKRP